MYVYFVQQGETGPIKIGCAVDVKIKVSGLQTCNPLPLYVRLQLPGGLEEESALHDRFAHARLRGEWFHPLADILEMVKSPPSNLRVFLGLPATTLESLVGWLRQMTMVDEHDDATFHALLTQGFNISGIQDAAFAKAAGVSRASVTRWRLKEYAPGVKDRSRILSVLRQEVENAVRGPEWVQKRRLGTIPTAPTLPPNQSVQVHNVVKAVPKESVVKLGGEMVRICLSDSTGEGEYK